MENQFFSEEEEKRLGEIVRTALSVEPSVPSRSSCPDPEVIRALAFNVEMDAATIKKITLHIAECYDCSMLTDKYLLEYRKQQQDES